MRKILNLILALIIISCQAQDNRSIKQLDSHRIDSQELSDEIQKIVNKAQVSGLGLSILQKQDDYTKSFGFKNQETSQILDNNTVFRGASLSKAVFAYIVVQLVIEKTIDLDKPLQHYLEFPLPELKNDEKRQSYAKLKEDERYKQITARMCLNHTTGFPNWRWMTKENDFLPEGNIRFLIDPGSRYYYSGEGIQLLQFVVEHLANKPLEEMAQEYVFKPLKMQSSSYVWQERFSENLAIGHDKEGKPLDFHKRTQANAAGSLYTTVNDYSKFLRHLLNLSSKKSPITELLFEPSVRITSKTQFGYQAWEDTNQNDAVELSYGLGFGILNTPYGKAVFKEGHDNGFQHYFILFPAEQKGVLLMSNSDNAESTFKKLLELTIGDTYTPWRWQRYTPYDQ
ncbi:beta-lactamase family protein [Polaribacter batillariae]|uniref:Beta-lactamase family protein n=1 Tax=Polaribacter batillariae TaxID=2808900 RepID=A0ABX7SXN0_9FLAO|nr:serine hydrolase domain-containing protein [Polaribacter batillariae]QTD38073.1 beta-lactamase family protein [Polaribacter batillariae]